MRWDGAVTIVTGASRGIGRAVARAAADRGARVGLVARSAPELDQVLREIGGHGVAAVADVGDPAEMQRAVAAVETGLGPVDVVVANAGIGLYGAFADSSLPEVERLVRVNVLGTMYLLRAVLPGMVARRRGHVVVIASIAGRVNGTVFSNLAVGQPFGGNLKVISLSQASGCGSFLFADEQFRLCKGQEVVK